MKSIGLQVETMEGVEPSTITLEIEPLEERIAPSIVGVHVNGGGNSPGGEANGVPTENQNPSGHAPPGQN
jgi:hypothetical protein